MSFGTSLRIACGSYAVRDAGRARVSRRNPAVRPCRPLSRLLGERERAADAHENRPPPGRRRRASARSTTLSHRGMSAPFRTNGDCALRRCTDEGHLVLGVDQPHDVVGDALGVGRS